MRRVVVILALAGVVAGGSAQAHGLSVSARKASLYAHGFGTGQTRKFHVSHPWSFVWQYSCVNRDGSLLFGGGAEIVVETSGFPLYAHGVFNPRGATGRFSSRKTGTYYIRVGTPCRWQVWVFG